MIPERADPRVRQCLASQNRESLDPLDSVFGQRVGLTAQPLRRLRRRSNLVGLLKYQSAHGPLHNLAHRLAALAALAHGARRPAFRRAHLPGPPTVHRAAVARWPPTTAVRDWITAPRAGAFHQLLVRTHRLLGWVPSSIVTDTVTSLHFRHKRNSRSPVFRAPLVRRSSGFSCRRDVPQLARSCGLSASRVRL